MDRQNLLVKYASTEEFIKWNIKKERSLKVSRTEEMSKEKFLKI